MDNEEAVEPQIDEMNAMIEQPLQEAQESNYEQEIEEHESRTKVPLSALQKERKKRQEAEIRLEYYEKQNALKQAPVEEDTSQYESATRADLKSAQDQAIQIIEERMWIKNNPEKYEKINELLPQFLKQRPNLARAINDAQNRYEEAWELMDKLSPKQQSQLSRVAPPKKEAPNAPTGIPKAASLNAAVDVMSMSDQEFYKWRQEQKRRR